MHPEAAHAEALDRSMAAREQNMLAQLLAAQQSRAVPPVDPSFALLYGLQQQQQTPLSVQDALRLASARRTVAQLELQQQQQQPSQLDLLLAQAQLKASLGVPSTGLRVPPLAGLSPSSLTGTSSLGMLSNPRTDMIQNILGLSENPEQSSDALRRALLESYQGSHQNTDCTDS